MSKAYTTMAIYFTYIVVSNGFITYRLQEDLLFSIDVTMGPTNLIDNKIAYYFELLTTYNVARLPP